MNARRPVVAVVGGGVAGLAAARDLTVGDVVDVVLVEASDRLGGMIATSEFAGRPVDEGADAFLARVPHAIDLCRELGLDGDLVSPAVGSALVWSRGALRRIPEGIVLGVPTDFHALARSGVVSFGGAARAAADLVLPGRARAGDESVGALVRRRMGDEVAELLVDPLLGGINAGDADRLSLAASAPQIAEAATHRSLAAGLRAQRRRAGAPQPGQPVFHALPEGMQRLTDALAAAVTGADVRLGTRVTSLARTAGRYRLDLDAGPAVDADAVVLAAPAWEAARLVRPLAAGAATALEGVEYASVVLVTMALPRSAVAHDLDASGFLVPRPNGCLMTACSFASTKWAHLAGDPVVLRVSAGRFGDERALDLDEGALVDALVAELGEMLGVGAFPTEVRVRRWPRAFPQYTPGHLERVAAIERELAAAAPGVALAGAAYRGVGIPACIAQGRAAAAAAARAATGRAGALVGQGEA